MPNLTPLAEYGIAGVCIALIVLMGFIINRVFKFMGNHITHEMDSWNKNTEALTKLAERIDMDIKAQQETTETLRDLKEIIKSK